MDDSESPNHGSYIQNIVENLKNKVFSPKAVAGLNSNMAAPPLDESTLEVVKLHAFVLAKDIVHYVSGFEVPEPANEHVKTMRRIVDALSIKHEILFRGMFNRLMQSFPENGEDACREIRIAFCGIGNEMLQDNLKNWGRIASLYAFGGQMAKRLVDEGYEDLVDHCALVIGEFICTVLANWIHQNGGWDAFDAYFVSRDQQAEKFEKRILQGLALVGGVGAALAVARIAVR